MKSKTYNSQQPLSRKLQGLVQLKTDLKVPPFKTNPHQNTRSVHMISANIDDGHY